MPNIWKRLKGAAKGESKPAGGANPASSPGPLGSPQPGQQVGPPHNAGGQPPWQQQQQQQQQQPPQQHHLQPRQPQLPQQPQFVPQQPVYHAHHAPQHLSQVVDHSSAQSAPPWPPNAGAGAAAAPASAPVANATSQPASQPAPQPAPQPPIPPVQPPSNVDDDDDTRFTLKVDRKLWPEFHSGQSPLDATGQLHLDFTNGLASRWAGGAKLTSAFGELLFRTAGHEGLPADRLPYRLFDLVQRRVVTAAEVGRANYAFISHVWGGSVSEVDGSRFGVHWKIPIRSELKLEQIFEAARVVTGERYIWLDVLCMDQSARNEMEIARMKSYLENATGCLVWLDNAFDDPAWPQVLQAIQAINAFYKLDVHGVPTISPQEFMEGGVLNLQMNEVEAFRWIKRFVALEKAPWFKRVWTLQEGVVPDKLYFCTPERYMTGCANIFQIIGCCGMVASVFMELGSMTGAAILHELHKSETWKMLRLRQLYRKKQVSFWHLAQAVRSRSCAREHDVLFGVCAMVQNTLPVIDYSRSIAALFQGFFKAAVDGSDFSAALFFDGPALQPDKDLSMGFIGPAAETAQETHRLHLDANGLRMENVGYATVTRVHCIVSGERMKDWGDQFPHFLDLSAQDNLDVATAFELPTVQVGSNNLCPAAFAAISAMNRLPDDMLAAFGDDFAEQYEKSIPQALMMWVKSSFLMQGLDSGSLVIVWAQGTGPQVAVVSEPVEGKVFLLTPSSYVANPGHGCMVCKLLPSGAVRKIGIGLGKDVCASGLSTFVLVP